MNATVLLRVWGVFTLVIVLLILLIRYRRTRVFSLTLIEVITVALGVMGLLSGFQVIYQAFTVGELTKLVGNEGIASMVIGGVATIWLAGGEIRKLL